MKTKTKRKKPSRRKDGKFAQKPGRKTAFREEFIEQARVACIEGGFTDLKLANLFGVCRATIATWKNEYPKFKEAIQEGKDAFDSLIAENSLLKCVKGFRYTEITRERTDDGQMVVTKKVSKFVPPVGREIEYFLNNRNRQRWSNRQDVNVSGDLTVELVNFGDGEDGEV